jgi:hypothetical protein
MRKKGRTKTGGDEKEEAGRGCNLRRRQGGD